MGVWGWGWGWGARVGWRVRQAENERWAGSGLSCQPTPTCKGHSEPSVQLGAWHPSLRIHPIRSTTKRPPLPLLANLTAALRRSSSFSSSVSSSGRPSFRRRSRRSSSADQWGRCEHQDPRKASYAPVACAFHAPGSRLARVGAPARQACPSWHPALTQLGADLLPCPRLLLLLPLPRLHHALQPQLFLLPRRQRQLLARPDVVEGEAGDHGIVGRMCSCLFVTERHSTIKHITSVRSNTPLVRASRHASAGLLQWLQRLSLGGPSTCLDRTHAQQPRSVREGSRNHSLQPLTGCVPAPATAQPPSRRARDAPAPCRQRRRAPHSSRHPVPALLPQAAGGHPLAGRAIPR